ncbi:hypothetical protein EJ03DRAFT_54737 [Teratosphaeria nubilosa]|uniref:Uncharacterized protein n=1 Tax=Teratosphaeria nubilosa TaxID=161662 RepID=A0A6G1LF05_9PEZI|nr:hypothetical protein EJ03DRAFT_54737 [Teratosphaeria nubilosa]
MGNSITITTLFGGMIAYNPPDRESLGMALAFCPRWPMATLSICQSHKSNSGPIKSSLGLAGVTRLAGCAVAVTIFATILTTTQAACATSHVVPAAEGAGATPAIAEAALVALTLGAATLDKIKGLTTVIGDAAGLTFVESYVQGVKCASPVRGELPRTCARTTALAGLTFGCTAINACCFLRR